MDLALVISAGVALAGVALAVVFLPRTSASTITRRPPAATDAAVVAVS
jgi:hypothetical protein